VKRAAWLLAFACGTVAAEPRVFRLDPAHTFVHFEVLHFGTSTLRGRIGPVDGAVTLDTAAKRGELGLRIRTATVDTGLRVLDSRLREPDLLAVEAYPEAYFVSRSFRFDGDAVAEVRGEFTLRNVSVPLSLKALRFACRDEGARRRCGGDFEGFVDRGDFGMSFGLPLIANRTRLLVTVEALSD
jgi:polyisoprenoid-binding protein YceI